MKCPKCGSNREHVYTFEVSPNNGKHWAVERCPHCSFGFDVELYSDHLKHKSDTRKDNKKGKYDGWNIRGNEH